MSVNGPGGVCASALLAQVISQKIKSACLFTLSPEFVNVALQNAKEESQELRAPPPFCLYSLEVQLSNSWQVNWALGSRETDSSQYLFPSTAHPNVPGLKTSAAALPLHNRPNPEKDCGSALHAISLALAVFPAAERQSQLRRPKKETRDGLLACKLSR